MEVLVRKPPVFTIEPEAMYQRKVSESVEMHCDAQEAEGTQKPTIQWQRRDGKFLKYNVLIILPHFCERSLFLQLQLFLTDRIG